jgi:hypothetical protein
LRPASIAATKVLFVLGIIECDYFSHFQLQTTLLDVPSEVVSTADGAPVRWTP